MEVIQDAQIRKIHEDYVVIGLSGAVSNPNCIVKKHLINFRGKAAPRNLLKLNTILKVKLSNNIPVSAEIDQNIEIIAIFGYIGDMNNASKTLIIKTYEYDQEIQYQELLGPDNKVLKEGTHQSYKSKPVILYFNTEAIIEARILNEPINNSYKLEEFYKNTFGKRETEFFVLKDDRLIPHKIHKSRIFYKNTDEIFIGSEVEKSIGTEVKVSIINGEIKAFVQKDIPKNLIQNHISSLSLPANRKTLHQLNSNPNYGKRQKLNSDFFIKEHDELENSTIMLISLLEICYRFPERPMKALLLQEITRIANIPRNELEKIEFLLNTTVNAEVGYIEKFYKLLKESTSVLQYVSKLLFKSPLNFNQICSMYKIYIFETTKAIQHWKTYRPLYVNEKIPIIYFCNDSKLSILYDSNMMLYDGYSPSGDEYIAQQYFNPDSIKIQMENQPNYLGLINAAKNLQAKLPRTDEDSFKIYFELVNALNTLIPDNIAPQYENLYQELLSFNYDPNYADLKCQCGSKANVEYQCNDHYLCNGCAFISSRLKRCLQCSAPFRIEINIKELNCTMCNTSYVSQYFFGFRCRCILCWNCLLYMLNQKSTMCYQSHELDNYSIELAIDFLRVLGYNPNS